MENNGKGIFYGVIGVATLIVAIIGATFAFFTATGASNTTTVTGTTATASSVGLAVVQVSPSETAKQGTSGRMVPLLDGSDETENRMTTALANDCVDANGYVACQVYEITVSNAAADAVLATTTMQLTPGSITAANLRWQNLTGTSSANFAVTGSAFSDHTNASTVKASDTINGNNGTGVYYVVVWLHDTGLDQTDPDAGKTFTGTVTANIVDASGNTLSNLTATFTTT